MTSAPVVKSAPYFLSRHEMWDVSEFCSLMIILNISFTLTMATLNQTKSRNINMVMLHRDIPKDI